MSPEHQTPQIDLGAPGQAPVRPDTLRQMLFAAKTRADDVQDKLTKSERLRADMANKMAAHAETMQTLTSLRELTLVNGEGVLLYVRRPDEATPYPIVIGKGELLAVEPENWWRDIVDPRARAVLDAADRAKGWLPADPAADERMREDYSACREVLQVEGDALVCEAADKIVTLAQDGLTRVRSLSTTEGKARAKVTALEQRVGELQAELELLREPEDADVEGDALAGIVGKHGTPKVGLSGMTATEVVIAESNARERDMAAASGPSYAGVELKDVSTLDTGGTPLDIEPTDELTTEQLVVEAAKQEAAVAAEAVERAKRIAAKRKVRTKPKEPEKAKGPKPPGGLDEPPADGLGPDERGDNSDSGKLERGNVRRDSHGEAMGM